MDNSKPSKRKRVWLNWSKKENDWLVHWPEWENRNSNVIAKNFISMITEFERFMSKDWEGKPTGFKDFRTQLRDAGFDPDTFTISVKELKQNS